MVKSERQRKAEEEAQKTGLLDNYLTRQTQPTFTSNPTQPDSQEHKDQVIDAFVGRMSHLPDPRLLQASYSRKDGYHHQSAARNGKLPSGLDDINFGEKSIIFSDNVLV